MSARSPRGSLSGASSAEVADDFRESLKDLQINNKYEISNLTVIAKENTESAQAISKVLENHIKTTPPTRKLPALYVLDSIVKNVGTPYTVYLGRGLYSTFMEAYTLVDSTTRRNMEGMLKTWKEPIPGSMDPRPVFPLETVRPIENALIKAKTAALHNTRHVQQQPDYRNTPTPPQLDGRFMAPPSASQAQPYYGYNNQQPPHHQQPAQPNLTSTPSQQQFQYLPPSSRPVNEVETITREVDALVSQRQGQFGANPYDAGLRQQLHALLQLQQILKSQSLDPGSLQQIRNQVSGLSATAPIQHTTTDLPNASIPAQWQPPVTSTQPNAHFAQPPVTNSQPLSNQPQTPAHLLAPSALEGLQLLLANGQKPGTPQMRTVAPALQNASHTQLNNVQNHNAAAPALNATDLIASLTKNGLLPNPQQSQPTPPAAAPTGAPPSQSTASLLQSLQGLLPPTSQTGTPTLPPAQLSNTGKPRIPMTVASLKTLRPELVSTLYEAQPNQCTTCGRRFLATDEGRAKKARHLDWHFRTNQRIADPATNRGAHRDWFPSELEWIQLQDFDPSTTTAADAAAAAAAGGGGGGGGTAGSSSTAAVKKQRPEEKYVRAPAGVTKNTCSICFEEMKSSYSEEVQDWVFTNATTHAGKIVHASCLADLQKGSQQGGSLAAALAAGGGVRQRSATPDSSLGKRKAEGLLAGVGTRLRAD